MTEANGHVFRVILRDELGVMAVCSCNRWGYAGSDEEKAHVEHARHLEEAGLQADARTKTED